MEIPPRWQDPFTRTSAHQNNMYPNEYPTPQATGFGDQASTSGGPSNPQEDLLRARAEEENRIQLILNKNLSPEYTSTRPGGGGVKLTYVEAHKLINIANEIFGYNGWYTEVKQLDVDFCDCIESKGEKRYTVSVSAVVRVWLRSGGHGHEDVGCGSSVNQKSKSDAYQSAKKEAITDGMKRALRLFGNVVGNCIYDKLYCDKVSKMKKPPSVPFSPDDLYYGIDSPKTIVAAPVASTSAAMAPPAGPAPRVQPQTRSNGVAQGAQAGPAPRHNQPIPPARVVAQQQQARAVARVPVLPLPNHTAPQFRAPAAVAAIEEDLFDGLDFSSQGFSEEGVAALGGGIEEGDSGYGEVYNQSTLESNENDPSVSLPRDPAQAAADAQAARLHQAQLKKQQKALQAQAMASGAHVEPHHSPNATTSAAQIRSNNTQVARNALRPAQPPTRTQSYNPSMNGQQAGPLHAIESRDFKRTISSGAIPERTVQAGQIPSFSVGSSGRMAVSGSVAGTGFVSAKGVKRSADGSSGDAAIDAQNYHGSSGSRAPLGEVELDGMGDVKRARYDA